MNYHYSKNPYSYKIQKGLTKYPIKPMKFTFGLDEIINEIKKLNLKSFKTEKKLLKNVLKDFYKSKNILISGGNTLDNFLKVLSKKNEAYEKKILELLIFRGVEL